jgi:hypothetical protein
MFGAANVQLGHERPQRLFERAADAMKKAIERFPDQAHLIGRLAEQYETFRSLCEDHQLAADTLDTLIATRPADNKLIGEYRTLVAELEADIAESLKKIV